MQGIAEIEEIPGPSLMSNITFGLRAAARCTKITIEKPSFEDSTSVILKK
jgi:hypothetical protein